MPTANAEAYRLYMQGREYYTRPGYLRQNLEISQQLYKRALALDPGFALAHAALSEVHSITYWLRYDPSSARGARQREEAETALRLAPDLPQAHIAMGRIYSGDADLQRALVEYEIALQKVPNDAYVWARIGYTHRRMGNWDEFFEAFDKATQLNPRDPDLFWDLGGNTYVFLHRYPDAVGAYDRALVLAPDLYVAAIMKAVTYVRWNGQLDTLRAVLGRVPSDSEFERTLNLIGRRANLLLWERKADSLLLLLQNVRVPVFDDQIAFLPIALYTAWGHRLKGDHPAARASFEWSRVLLDSVLEKLPNDWRVHTARGLTLSGLGLRHEALGEAQWLQQSKIYRTDIFFGGELAVGRAQILAQAGDAEGALDEIDRLLVGPSWLSVNMLRLDPLWDPLRSNPRFQALVVKAN